MAPQQFTPVAPPIASPVTRCDICRSIDFEHYLNHPIKKRISLRNLREMSSNCPFCRLVIECIRRKGLHRTENHQIWLHNALAWQQSVVYAVYNGQKLEGYSNKFDLEDLAKRTNGKSAHRFVIKLEDGNDVGQIQYVAYKEPPQSRHFFGRPVDPQRINLPLVKSWLPHCEDIHKRSCSESEEASKRLRWFRVIDVHTRQVIRAPPGCRYVALSYVWGEQRSFFASTRSCIRKDSDGREFVILPQGLPRTIEDAIKLTRQLGERYLWVDSLCIIQDSLNERHNQILRMDAIYSSAELTIVAASGSNANAGLPGVSIPRWRSQYSQRVNGLRFAVVLPNYNSLEADKTLPWNHRAWTLQEKILSKRLLVFTHYQVYFACSNTVFCEDINMETDRYSTSVVKKWRPLRWAPDRNRGEDIGKTERLFSSYQSIIEAFSKRDLSRREDGIDAIEGVLGILGISMGKFHCGLPETYFGQALLWQPPLHSKACIFPDVVAPFPSWTWGRWNLDKGCTWLVKSFEETLVLGRIFLITSDRMEEILAPRKQDHLARKITYHQEDLPPTPRLSSFAKQYLRCVGSVLYLNTTVAEFRIGSCICCSLINSATHRRSRTCDDDQYHHYELLGKRNRRFGDVWLSESMRVDLRNGYQTFISISWCRNEDQNSSKVAKPDGQSDSDYENSQEEATFVGRKNVNVMLVKWQGGIARRYALGTIIDSALRRHSIGNRWVLLG